MQKNRITKLLEVSAEKPKNYDMRKKSLNRKQGSKFGKPLGAVAESAEQEQRYQSTTLPPTTSLKETDSSARRGSSIVSVQSHQLTPRHTNDKGETASDQNAASAEEAVAKR